MEKVEQRLLRYVKINTKSDDASESIPSTKIQFDLANLLVDELKALGITDAHVDENCYVMGTLKGNVDNAPKIGLIAHLDTSPDMPGENVKPQIVENYDGGDIVLNKDKNIVMKVSDFSYLKDFKGKTLITTDGTTLLGADDKAGIAEIFTAMEYLLQHPEIKHGKIRVCITPDEEVGQGTKYFDVAKFGADFAYTIDGGQIGELEFENFNAAGAKIIFKGLNVHPGYAKDKMVNASLLALDFASWLPSAQRPENTTGYEGFFHLTNMTGSVEEATLSYIVRDHDRNLFEQKKQLLQLLVDRMNGMHPESTRLEIRDQYYNMREVVEPQKHIIDIAFEAMTAVGVKPLVKPIRGGTDGARLSFMGLPCPNIFAGGLNFHGRYEFLPVKSLEKSMETIIKITELTAQKS